MQFRLKQENTLSTSSEKILVTGSAGFIGFHLCRRLLEAGHQVVGVDCFNSYYFPGLKEMRSEQLRRHPAFTEYRMDLCDRNGLEKIFRDFQFTRVCNFAAQAGVRYSLTNPYAYNESNITAFLNLLEMVRHHQVPRFLYASSSSVYGGNTKIPFSESDRVDAPISLYAASKRANELMAHCYSHLFGFQTIGLRFFTVYGPWGRPDMAMWLFAEAIRLHQKIKVFNFGDMRRDFTYIDDIVNGVMAALFADNLDRCEIFNLGNNRSEKLLDMIGLIEREMGSPAEKELLPLQPGDVPESFADIDKARAKLGFQPATTIADGVPRFVAWYKENQVLADQVIDWRRQSR